jgi:peptidoglycan hydrolase-like protein with peptidoglycan-binding domain
MAEENTTDNTKNKKDTTGLSQFDLDKIAGVGMSKKQAKVIDTTDIDKQIAALEKPASGSVYDKLAARYRSQGEGAVLRTQKNLANLFGPTVNLIQEREAAAQARFTLLKDKLPEFDDTKIFGMQSGNEMPIVAEIERISKTTKEDMRMLSRLNPNDERYDEIKKRIDKNQNAIVAFDEINQKLLEIRNSQDGREDDSQWSRGMDSATRQMWEDIYASKGENITIQDGKLVWTSTGGKSKEIKTKSNALNNISSITEAPTEEKNIIKLQKNLQDLGYDIGSTGADGKYGPKTKAAYEKFLKEKESIQSEIDSAELEGVGETRVIDLNEIGDGPTTIDNLGIQKDIEIQDGIQVLINSNVKVTDPRYNQKIDQLIRTLNSAGPKGIKSLIFDGFGAQPGDVLKSTNTDSFIQQIIQNNPEEFGIKDINNLTEEEIANAYDIMRSRDVTYDYKNNEETLQTLQSQYLQWYRNEIDTKVREGKKSKLVAEKIEQQNKNKTTTTVDIDDSLLEETKDVKNIDYIVSNIWDPNVPTGYEIGENGKALVQYFKDQKLGTEMKEDIEITSGLTLFKENILKIGDFVVFGDGEQIEIYEQLENGKWKEIKSWTGDSLGGKSYDKEDIQQIFKYLGLQDHLTQNVK